MKKTKKVDDVVAKIEEALASYPIPGKRSPERSNVCGRHVDVVARLGFGIEIRLGVGFELDYNIHTEAVEVVAKTNLSLPSKSASIEELAGFLPLLNAMYALGAMAGAMATEMAEEIDPKSF